MFEHGAPFRPGPGRSTIKSLKLSSFVEKDVFPFLADLMKHLLSLLEKVETDETTLKLKELAFSCIASIGEFFKSMDC